MRRMVLVTAGAIALAGCGGGGGGGGGSDPMVDPKVANWKVTDACALVSKDAIGAALKSPVKETSLNRVNADPSGEQSSNCSITLENGRTFGMTAYRGTTTGDAESQKSRRDFMTSLAGGEPTVDVPGVGVAAIWSPKLRLLWGYFDDARAVEVSMRDDKLSDAEAKAAAAAVARAAGAA